jgi:eukaryotic-like serine/threonine-protein kinase
VDDGRPASEHRWSGRFENPTRVGIGGQAEVYRAFDPVLDGMVALKVLHAQQANLPEWRERLIAEARATRRVGGDRLAIVHDLVELDGRPALVMEYAAAGTLADLLASHVGPPNQEDLIRLVSELADCLRALEAGGIVHRDLKPSNLLIRRLDGRPAAEGGNLLGDRERIIVTDLGLARPAAHSAVTMASGTTGYQPPEQMRPSATVDHRADLFAATQVVLAAMFGAPVMVDEIRTRIPDHDSARRVAGCLASDPADRPPDADAWADIMLAVLPALTGKVPAGARRERRVSHRWALAVIAVGLLVSVAAGIVWLRPSNEPTLGPDGPQIVGPDTLLIGELGRYRHEDRAGVNYEWRLPSGKETDATTVTVTPAGPDDFTLWLTSDDQGDVRSSRLVVRVRTR